MYRSRAPLAYRETSTTKGNFPWCHHILWKQANITEGLSRQARGLDCIVCRVPLGNMPVFERSCRYRDPGTG
jgi:hypothetical protein